MCGVIVIVGGNGRCLVTNCENATSTDFTPWWLNQTIPWDSKNRYIRQCQRYNQTWDDVTQCQFGDVDVTTTIPCDAWIYDKTDVHSSIVTEVIYKSQSISNQSKKDPESYH